MEHFDKVLVQYGPTFHNDNTHSLIVRLRQNVIKTAVKQISLAYSRISIEDAQKKLQLSHPDVAEYVVSKVGRFLCCETLLFLFREFISFCIIFILLFTSAVTPYFL